ncbi:MAG: 4Fe-4S binding protein [Armatimonadota bacterium]
MRRIIIAVALIVCVAAAGFALERFPPPEFESGYQFPDVITPGPREAILEYADIAVLVVALALGAYLALKKRSRSYLVLLAVFGVLYFGFYREGCICSIGAIQNVSLAIFDAEYALPLSVAAFFAIPLVFALFFGRVFCAGVCPLGAVQEIVLLRPVKVPKWLDDTLSVFPFIYLGAAVLFAATGSAFVICRHDPFVQFF